MLRNFLTLVLLITFALPSFAKKRRLLDLTNQNITDVSVINIPKSVRTLLLSQNQISDLTGLNLPVKIKNLNLDENQITDLSNLVLQESLIELSLTGNPLEDISSLSSSSSIRRLFIGNTTLNDERFSSSNLPPNLNQLAITINLFTNLDLSSVNNLDFLFIGPGKVNGSDSLDGADYSKVVLPQDLKKIGLGSVVLEDDFTGLVLPENLEELQAAFIFMELEELQTLTFSPNLKKIFLQFNSLDSLEGIDFPETLEVLNLRNNQLTTLDGVDIPDSIRVLNLRNNGFSKAERRKIRKRFGKKVRIRFSSTALCSQ